MHECHLGEEARAELLDLRLVLARHALELVGRHLGRDGLLRLDQEHRHLVKGGARATARVRTRVRARARVRARIRARVRVRVRVRARVRVRVRVRVRARVRVRVRIRARVRARARDRVRVRVRVTCLMIGRSTLSKRFHMSVALPAPTLPT